MRGFLRFAMVGLTMTALTAGCLDSGDGEADGTNGVGELAGALRRPVSLPRLPDPEHDFATEWDWTHGGNPGGHVVPSLHEHSFGLELVGYNPMTRLSEGASPLSFDSSYIAMDTWSDGAHYYACVAHFATYPGGGAEIVDVTDPANPVVLSSALSGMANSDCQFTDDGNLLLVAAYTGRLPGLPLDPPVGDLLALGVEVYDVTDKSAPRFLFHDTTDADPNAYHNVFTAKIGGKDYVFQTYTGNVLELDVAGGALRHVAKLEVADHDLWVGRHPISGQWLVITGAGDAARIYGVDDPANPVLLSDWEPSASEYTGWHRQWPLENTVDGHALMVVAGEEGVGNEGHTWYTVLDFSDPTQVIELGHWTIPAMGETQHEFEIWDGYVATGNYHQGVWLFDVGTLERAMEPVTLGYYLPHENPLLAGGTVNLLGASNPNVWGAYFDDRGYIYAADHYSGLYVLKFGATRTSAMD